MSERLSVDKKAEASVKARFDALQNFYLLFDSVSEKVATRPDVCALVLLDRWFPSSRKTDIITVSNHDEIFLGVTWGQLATLTDEQIKDLVCCGVRYDSYYGCLSKYV